MRQCPLLHVANLLRNKAIQHKLRVVRRAQIYVQELVAVPDVKNQLLISNFFDKASDSPLVCSASM